MPCFNLLFLTIKSMEPDIKSQVSRQSICDARRTIQWWSACIVLRHPNHNEKQIGLLANWIHWLEIHWIDDFEYLIQCLGCLVAHIKKNKMKFRKCALSCRSPYSNGISSAQMKEHVKRKKQDWFFQRICCRAFLFIPCLSQPNKFVIVVYTADMIFTLYRCDDWQIGFQRVCSVLFCSCTGSPIPSGLCL